MKRRPYINNKDNKKECKYFKDEYNIKDSKEE